MLSEQKEAAGPALEAEDHIDDSPRDDSAQTSVDDDSILPSTTGAHSTPSQIGRYLLGKRLGRGGAASVYQAYDQIQDRLVALKILSSVADNDLLQRFRQEARTVAKLRHPHIVQALQVGDVASEGAAYIAMELVQGDSLAQLLERRGRLSVAESCNLLAPIARALDYAHQHGIVHRDVKPSNILLRPVDPDMFSASPPDAAAASALNEAEQILTGGPVNAEDASPGSDRDLPVAPLLSDFGIARALDMPELTSVGRTIGTPAYMAPEQCASSREVTGQSDIYSLGAVLFRCLFGRPPYTGTTTQILHAHVYASLALPDDMLASLPRELVDVLRRSLAKNAGDRYAAAREMADDLTAIAGRVESLENGLAEQTSTLTLVSLPSVVLPPPNSQSAETVIVPGAESRTDATPQDVPPAQPSQPAAQDPPPGVSSGPGARNIAIVLGILLALGLLVFTPLLRNVLPGVATSSTPVSLINDPAPVPSLQVAAPQTPSEDAPNLATTSDSSSLATQQQEPDAASQPPSPASADAPSACQYQTAAEFSNFFGGNEAAAQQLGCAKGVPTYLSFEIQMFQTGMALGRLDRPTVYVRYSSNSEWEQREHDWRQGMPEAVSSPDLQAPAEDLFQPVRGIGQVWAEDLFVRQALGWAVDQPLETSGVLQSFEGGLLVYNNESQESHIFLKSQLRL